ncbi:hypothetical protein [Ghiorsea bivora]|uniref:hypothetical protein n=1 Tax=Ghiorsea bivora TaxID=1485545 RepID=UPI0005717B5C|nr:hypothetical protein [Ghiorsea bivora]
MNNQFKVSLLNGRENILVTCSVIIIIAIAWLGTIDVPVEAHINDSIVNAAAIYAISRGINAVLSLLQSVDISIVVASFSPGELLDPINDMIERFSEVMTYALASLAMQKILIVLAQQNIFSIFITIAGTAYLYFKWVHHKFLSYAFQTFITLVFLRFFLVLVLLVNGLVDTYFIDTQIHKEKMELSTMEGKLNSINTFTKGSLSTADEMNEESMALELQAQGDNLDQQIATEKAALESQRNKVQVLEDQLSLLNSDEGLVDVVKNVFASDDTPEILAERERLTSLEASLESVTESRENITRKLECVQKNLKGEECILPEAENSFTWNPVDSLKEKIAELKESSGKWFESVITLLALMLLKTIVFPLLFLYGVVKVVKLIWRRESLNITE